MAKWEHNLPSVLNPVGDICVRVTIPAHPDYIKLFVRAVRQLEVNRMYQRDENLSAKIVVEQWRNRTVTPLIEALANSTGLCDGLDGECLTYPPFASFISYSPQNPYTEPDLIPDGYEQPPFYVNGRNPSQTLPNYENGDVIVDFGSITLDTGFGLENVPQIQLCLEGSGVLELKLLSIVQGGVVVITVDNPPDILDILGGLINDDLLIVDTNQDIVSIPPETATEIIQEIEIETEGEHIVYITFLPIIDDSLIPLRFGGGLRSVSLCGNLRPCGVPEEPPPPPLEGVTELRPAFQFTPECGFEYRLYDQNNEIVQDWTPVAGWDENAFLCFGGNMPEPIESTYDAIKNGIYDAFNDLAKQVVSGSKFGFSVDEDGNVVIGDPNAPSAELPEDDPLTTINEEKAARYGGLLEVAAKLELVLDKADTFFGVPSGAVTPVTSLADATAAMQAYFACDEPLMAAAMNDYYNWRLGGATQINFARGTAFPLFLYCNGYDYNALARYMADSSGFIFSKQAICLGLWKALVEKFYSDFYNIGIQTPSNSYLDADCVPVESQSFTNVPFSSIRTTTIMKAYHRLRVKITGVSVDSNGHIQDAFWFVNGSTGVRTRTNPTLTHVGSVTQPSDNQVVYNSAHAYDFTIDLNVNPGNPFSITMNKNGTHAGTPSPNFTIEITDLGRFTG